MAFAQEIIETEPGFAERVTAILNLEDAMRADLGVDGRTVVRR